MNPLLRAMAAPCVPVQLFQVRVGMICSMFFAYPDPLPFQSPQPVFKEYIHVREVYTRCLPC